MADILDEATLRDFVDEAREHLVVLNRDFLELEARGADAPAELVNEAFRAIHTIKGLSGMLGIKAINGLAHGMEDALAEVRQGKARLAGLLAQILFEGLDRLSSMIDVAARGTTPEDDCTALLGTIAVALKSPGGAAAEAPAGGAAPVAPQSPESSARWARYTARGLSIVRVKLPFDRDTPQDRRRLLGVLEGLEGLGEVVALEPEDLEKRLQDRKKIRKLDAAVVFATRLGATELATDAQLEETRFELVAAPAERSAPEPRAEERGSASRATVVDDGTSQSIRVDAGKLDRVLALVGELVILRSRYNHVATEALTDLGKAAGGGRHVMALHSELNEVESTMGRTLGELQDAVMNARLVPLGSVFGKLKRIARDTAAKEGKKVRFEAAGGETELDKKVIDQIAAPLTHLVRNAVDHGIESPEARAAAGKDADGVVSLAVWQEGDRVVIEVADDGRGLDRARIKEKAVERGLVAPDAELGDRECLELICRPGFSTATEVTDVSGRGVGMDVVTEAVASLKGVLQVESVEGSGSTFRIKLPLTMAIMDALLVSVSHERYAIAVGSVREIVELEDQRVHVAGGRRFFRSGDASIPIVHLCDALDVPVAAEAGVSRTVVIVDSGEGEVGLAVDGVVGQQEIVVKSLSRRFEDVAEVSGGSVLGDGSVCLILDVPSLVARHGRDVAAAQRAAR